MTTEEQKQKRKQAYQAKNKRQTRNAFLVIGAIVLLSVVGRPLWGIVGVNIPYSQGERSVKIVKLAQKGLIWKTWEAQGALTQGGFTASYIWDFSVDDWDPNKEALVRELKDAFETGRSVKVRYDQRAGSVPWRSDTAYFVKEIR